MSGAMSVEEVKKHVKTYVTVFIALMVFTVITVGISYFHLPIGAAVAVALVIASIKASLVALFFMHLSHEKKIIYWALGLTAVLFVFLMTISFYA